MSASETHLTGVVPAPTEEEGAAIVAAIEHFMHTTAGSAPVPAQPVDPWQRAAILEGVTREPRVDIFDPWINT